MSKRSPRVEHGRCTLDHGLKPRAGAVIGFCPDTGDLPSMDYRSVGRHNTETSAYVVYDDLVYDITGFLRLHPGGKYLLMAALGTDVTNTLESFHDVHVDHLIRSDRFGKSNGIRVVAKLAPTASPDFNRSGYHKYQSRREYRRHDPLGYELRKQVMSYIRRNGLSVKKSLTECLLHLGFFYGLYGIAMYMAFIQASPLWCILLGPIVTFMVVNVGHTVMHGGFSNSPVVNLLGRSLGDIGGYSSGAWDVEHQGHHQAPHTKIDLQTAPPTALRFFEHQEYKWFHRYQMYYMWILFIFFSPITWVVHSYNTLFNYPSVLLSEKAMHVGCKLFGFVLPITMSFVLFDFGVAFGNLFLFAFSMSYCTLFSLFIQHADSYLPEHENEPWSVRQVTTSVSWYANSRVFEWLFGYFNYHTEHHLFPGLNPALYPKIQPIVRSLCAEFGVHYKHVSYAQLVGSQIGAWIKYSKPGGPSNFPLPPHPPASRVPPSPPPGERVA